MAETHRLFGSRGSGSAAIEVALRVCALPYKVIRASEWEADSAIDELARFNPLRQVPCLVLPDGTVLTESAAILIHLGLQMPASGLLSAASNPQSRSRSQAQAHAHAQAQAQAIRGLVFIAANCYAAISVADYPERWTTASTKAAQAKVRLGARRQLHRHWEVFADTFAATPYLTGASPGALDFLAAVVSKWSGSRQHLAQSRPGFLRTLQLIEDHEIVATVFKEHWPA